MPPRADAQIRQAAIANLEIVLLGDGYCQSALDVVVQPRNLGIVESQRTSYLDGTTRVGWYPADQTKPSSKSRKINVETIRVESCIPGPAGYCDAAHF